MQVDRELGDLVLAPFQQIIIQKVSWGPIQPKLFYDCVIQWSRNQRDPHFPRRQIISLKCLFLTINHIEDT